jgi:hypothetical protein
MIHPLVETFVHSPWHDGFFPSNFDVGYFLPDSRKNYALTWSLDHQFGHG